MRYVKAGAGRCILAVFNEYVKGMLNAIERPGNSISFQKKGTEQQRQKSAAVFVTLKPETSDNRKFLPVRGADTSTKELLSNYGNMAVAGIYVTGVK